MGSVPTDLSSNCERYRAPTADEAVLLHEGEEFHVRLRRLEEDFREQPRELQHELPATGADLQDHGLLREPGDERRQRRAIPGPATRMH